MRSKPKAQVDDGRDDAAIAVYVKFLQSSAQEAQSPGAPNLEVLEMRLLDKLACLWAQGEAVTVLQAMHVDIGLAPTTLHRKLKGLRRKGMVSLRENEADNRIKHVVPTLAAKRHLGNLGRCVIEAAR